MFIATSDTMDKPYESHQLLCLSPRAQDKRLAQNRCSRCLPSAWMSIFSNQTCVGSIFLLKSQDSHRNHRSLPSTAQSSNVPYEKYWGDKWAEHGGFGEQWNYVMQQYWIHAITHLSKPIGCTTPRVNCNVLNYGLCVIMMCHCRFISSNKCTTPVGDVDSGKCCACMCGWKGCIGTLYLPLNFAVNLKFL